MATKKQEKKITVEILIGLPGAGKTAYSQDKYNRHMNSNRFYGARPKQQDGLRVSVVDMGHVKYGTKKRYDNVKIENVFSDFGVYDRITRGDNDVVIVEVPFGTNQKYAEMVEALIGVPMQRHYASLVKNLEIQFHYWTPDWGACYYNNLFRSDNYVQRWSKVLLDDIQMEIPAGLWFDALKNVSLVEHTTKRKSEFQLFKDYFGFHGESDYLKSDTWSQGGTWGDCWGNSGSVSSDPPLANFKEFDEFIEKVWPDITFIQYKKLHSDVVDSSTENDHDYYGGSRQYGFFRADLWKLYEALKDRIMIKVALAINED